MPSQGPPPQYYYSNNDYRGQWQVPPPHVPPPPYMDDRYGHQAPMIQGPPPQYPPQNQPGVYRGPNWAPNNYQQQYNNYNQRNNWGSRNHHGGSSRSSSRSSRSSSSRDSDMDSDMCFICRDLLQNCEQLGIHLCDGGRDVSDKMKGGNHCEIRAKLDKIVEDIKANLKDKHEILENAINQHVVDKVGEIETVHKHAIEEKIHLKNLKKQLEDRAAELEMKEKNLTEKEKNLMKEQTTHQEEVTKEKEEICRQWQQLRDEITRMEKMHEVKKVYDETDTCLDKFHILTYYIT